MPCRFDDVDDDENDCFVTFLTTSAETEDDIALQFYFVSRLHVYYSSIPFYQAFPHTLAKLAVTRIRTLCFRAAESYFDKYFSLPQW